MINGLVKPSSGKILLDGKDISNEDMVDLRRKIGYSIQGTFLFPHLTVEENIAYVPKLIDKKDTFRKIIMMKIIGIDVLIYRVNNSNVTNNTY
ncbi:Molybdate/tungstate import ATP-binding protein WtpC [Candidatus Methanobinarius endosymbioticus]|uniref:Molybdate/tungstate import ATP-binding protein WtpC n=1 Tax=Candidatus Methanobinarius endosymbioticus TaxID=2006182 RepID=A0A366M905_9EURY|nr:Molybdate/tungstate import ATP-binding protein WtpC [Candidatus Methanobinarius endosymbioticus]